MSHVDTETASSDPVKDARAGYLEAIKLIERLHRQFLEVVKTELDRFGIEDINNIQALILFNIGEEELTVGELTNRGYYLGSNVSYNVRKMVENGYLVQERSTHDRRSIRVKLSDKGLELCARMNDMFDRHAASMAEAGIRKDDLADVSESYRALERFWISMLNYNLRGGTGPL
ncbi:MAG: MarR family winged helix-turn-helix transcriptional regulator [Alphaproteobacteria bacterium]|nr:MarR family winged helix-turn-helix transcriptional regulator [Alphaproteobacteria bacterium]